MSGRLRLRILIGFLVLVPASAASGLQATATYAGGFRFTLPKDWKAITHGELVRITAADGSSWTLKRDDSLPQDTTDATRSARLRDAAEAIAKGLISEVRYAGVKPLAVAGGNGAIYRFRGRGKGGSDDLVEVYVAAIGKRVAFLSPVSAPQSDHAYELSVLMRGLSNTDATSEAKTAPVAPPLASKSTVKPDSPKPAVEGRRAEVDPPSHAIEIETYEGHIVTNDVAFKLHVFKGDRVTAEWEQATGQPAKYSGTYSGTDGNYAVKMQALPSSTAAQLNLAMRSTGGMVNASYTTSPDGASRPVAELKLTAVDSGNTKLRGGRGGAQNGSRGRRNTNNRNTNLRRYNPNNRSRNTRRVIVIPGINNGPGRG